MAMTHSSYCRVEHKKMEEISATKIRNTTNVIPLQEHSYERLEYLGDSIIHAVLADYIFTRFPMQQEGFMTKLRTKLENSETLARLSQIIGLDNYLLISRYYEENNSRNENIHLLEDIFEAFIGATYIDGNDGRNFNVCRSLFIGLIERNIDITEILRNETNYKDMLLQYAHSQKMPDPVYGTTNVSTSQQHSKYDTRENKLYEMYVKIGSKIKGIGIGNSKKKGEQMAAEDALRKFGVINDDSDDSDEECEYKID